MNSYLLVTHGSPDPRPQIAANQLAEAVDRLLGEQSLVKSLVKTAVLECHPLPLHQQIQAFAQSTPTRKIQILPLFLLPGVHVMKDIPAEVAIAQQHLGDSIKLEICPHLGTDSTLYQLLEHSPLENPSLSRTGRVLMSHGSRRAGGNAPVEAIAAQLQAMPAYWSVAPSLDTQVKALAGQGCKQITILPYFLFAGGITDTIRQAIAQLRQQFPDVHLQMTHLLGENSNLAEHVVNLIP